MESVREWAALHWVSRKSRYLYSCKCLSIFGDSVIFQKLITYALLSLTDIHFHAQGE